MLVSIRFLVIVLLVFTLKWTQAPVIAQSSNPQQEAGIYDPARHWPYGDFAGQAPDPQRAEAFLDFLTRPGWQHGMPLQLLEIVGEQPTRFAPVIRARLMRLPESLDEYLRDRTRDEPKYSITATENMRPSGPPASRLLVVVSQLDRDHAEPILREFFDRVHPLAVDAKQRFWQIEDARKAAGKPVDRGPNAREPWETWSRFKNVRGQTLMVAQKLDSPIFIDDVLAMLTSESVVVRDAGAAMANYVLHFADARPDAVTRLHQAAAALARSNNVKDLFAAKSLQRKLEKAALQK